MAPPISTLGAIIATSALLGALILSPQQGSGLAVKTARSQPADKYWVTADYLNRRTCPSTNCGIVGRLIFREAAHIYERQGGWARISNYYNASCWQGRSEYVEAGNSECTPENGIVDGRFAEWVSTSYLSKERPPDPSAHATEAEALIAGSQDFRTYRDVFRQSADQLLSSGRCSEDDFRLLGGWMRSTRYDGPIYYLYCGGSTERHKVYLNAETGEILR